MVAYRLHNGTIATIRRPEGRCLCAEPRLPVFDALEGEWQGVVKVCPLSPANAAFLRHHFPFTAPVPVPDGCASFSTGDRLGLATPGHVRALRAFEVFPVFAQQSMRELARTGRTIQDVIDCATFGVFQEGWESGFAADADHIKTAEDALRCLQAGFTMFTIDAADHIQHQGKNAGEIYDPAIAHIAAVYRSLCSAAKGRPFTFEVSIDETSTDTLPEHHAYVARALKTCGVQFQSLAPKFVGEFQKGIDYRGSIGLFEKQFAAQAEVARSIGGYKLSVHSGSDKFSIYPIIGHHSRGLFHCKTAGTSWLEAVRVAAIKAPSLYRQMHEFALTRFENDRRSYHVTASLSAIPSLSKIADAELPDLLNKEDSRQLMHITYGSILSARNAAGYFIFRDKLYNLLEQNEDLHYEFLQHHISHHLKKLGVPARCEHRISPLPQRMKARHAFETERYGTEQQPIFNCAAK